MTSPPAVKSRPESGHRRRWPGYLLGLLSVLAGLLLWAGSLLVSLPPASELGPLMRKVQPQSLPTVLSAAVVEHEDRRFYQHGGLDVIGLLRASWSSLGGGGLQGGSTLTQQLVKNTLLADQHGARTLTRKLQEAWLAVQVERLYSKPDILRAYLSVAYWGSVGEQQVVGDQQAAQAYFGVRASQLDLAQSAYLATLLPAPARAAHPAEVRPLVRVLLDQMVADGRATAAQAAAARLELNRLAVLR